MSFPFEKPLLGSAVSSSYTLPRRCDYKVLFTSLISSLMLKWLFVPISFLFSFAMNEANPEYRMSLAHFSRLALNRFFFFCDQMSNGLQSFPCFVAYKHEPKKVERCFFSVSGRWQNPRFVLPHAQV